MAATDINWQSLAIAVAGGLLPSLVWLWFWLREDKANPEPDGLIALSFFAGMAIVYFVLPLQQFVLSSISTIMDITNSIAIYFSTTPPDQQTVQISLWAFIEEIAKYATVFFIAFKSKYFDEPMDAVMYLITAALGFAAMENTLYILKDIAGNGAVDVLINGNMRFIGATIVHIVSSSVIGLALAFSFYASRYLKVTMAVLGIIIASLLHAYFNLSIIGSDGTLKTLFVFSQFWITIIVLIVLLQIVKRIKPN